MAPVLLLAMAIPAFGAGKKASSTHPPRDLHMVGDHWTPYNPPDPSTYPPNAKTYTIKRGDTLWALARQFYGNAYLWPQLWETNTWITDAHWIYPGDVLLVEGEAASSQANVTTGTTATTTARTSSGGTTSGTASGTTASQQTTAGTAPSSAMAIPPATTAEVAPVIGPPVPLGSEADVYCYGYIGDPHEAMPNHVESFEDTEVLYQAGAIVQTNGVTTGDLIFVAGGTSTGIMPGETYLVVEPLEMVIHPRTKQELGRHYDFRGQIRILCADETHARAVVTQACKEIHAGSKLKPLPQLPIPLARVPQLPGFCETPSGKTSGYIVSSAGWELALADGNLVQIDLGRDDQVQPGDFLTVWRESPAAGQPRQILGEIGILTSEAKTSTAKVMLARRHLELGDHVEVK